jgi:hypothetical protein
VVRAAAAASAKSARVAAGEVVGVILDVPAVAEDRKGQAGGADRVLAGLVLAREDHGAGVGAQEAGVDDPRGAGGPGGVHDRLVLRHALPERVGRDQQHPVRARQRRGEGLGAIIVALARVHAARRERRERLGAARDGDDLRAGDAARQQRLDDQLPQLPRGARDRDLVSHWMLLVWSVLAGSAQPGREDRLDFLRGKYLPEGKYGLFLPWRRGHPCQMTSSCPT